MIKGFTHIVGCAFICILLSIVPRWPFWWTAAI
jgi:hypothetical protein